MSKKKLLVVEDDSAVRVIYRDYLASVEAEIDYAESKFEAIEKIRCKTYHLAFVDIMLKEDISDRGGTEVVRYLHDLNEGTKIIVVSGTDDIKVAIDTFSKGIVHFMQKDELSSEVEILRLIDEYLYKVKLNNFGYYDNLKAYLATPELVQYWVDTTFRALNVDYVAFDELLNIALEKYLPILRLKNAHHTLSLDSNRNVANGRFWSKGIGYPIWFSMANPKGELIEPENKFKGELLWERKKGKLYAWVWKLINTKRDEFEENIWIKFDNKGKKIETPHF